MSDVRVRQVGRTRAALRVSLARGRAPLRAGGALAGAVRGRVRGGASARRTADHTERRARRQPVPSRERALGPTQERH